VSFESFGLGDGTVASRRMVVADRRLGVEESSCAAQRDHLKVNFSGAPACHFCHEKIHII
jgi:hypothetical protein